MTVAAIVLAAGRSVRMGFPKASVEVRGRPALRTVVDSLDAAQFAPVITVLGERPEQWLALLDGSVAVPVVNSQPSRGQTSSLLAGLALVPHGSDFVVFPVDHAHVAPATLERLLAAWRERSPMVDCAVPVHEGRRGHPAFFRSDLRYEFMALAPEEPAHGIVRSPHRHLLEIPVDDPAVVRDFDRPQDLPPVGWTEAP